MLRCMTLVRNDNSEERSTSIMRMTRIGELVTTLAATSNRRVTVNVVLSSQNLVTLMIQAIRSSE
jgi:hypothetical protein